jgi:spoIIIJ-associated protein
MEKPPPEEPEASSPSGDGPSAARRLQEILAEFADSIPFEITCRISEEAERIRVEVDGNDRDLFLERRGEGLQALQVVLGRVVSTETSDKPILVDSAGFRQGRDEEIVEIAMLAAEKVKKMKEPHRLSLMDPYERRIVHLALKDNPDVETESEGEGFQKRVVIRPRATAP